MLSQDPNSKMTSDTIYFKRNSFELTEAAKKKMREYSSFILDNVDEHKFYLMDFSCYEEKKKNSLISFQRFKSILDLYDKEFNVDRNTFLMIDSNYSPLIGCGSKEKRRFVIIKIK